MSRDDVVEVVRADDTKVGDQVGLSRSYLLDEGRVGACPHGRGRAMDGLLMDALGVDGSAQGSLDKVHQQEGGGIGKILLKERGGTESNFGIVANLLEDESDHEALLVPELGNKVGVHVNVCAEGLGPIGS